MEKYFDEEMYEEKEEEEENDEKFDGRKDLLWASPHSMNTLLILVRS